MTTLRARRGNTSSGVIFWLMAAIRKNERIGPGMDTSSAGAEFSEPEVNGAPERCPGAGGTAPKEGAKSPERTHRNPERRNTERVRRDFIAHTSTDRWRR